MSFLKSLSVQISLASFRLQINDTPMLVLSMVLSTIQVIAILTIAPWLVPVLMADVQKSPM